MRTPEPPPFMTLEAGLPHAAHAFGTRHAGETVSHALHTAQEVLGGEIALMHQVHGDAVCVAETGGEHGPCDALVTTKPDLWLAVKTADCTPVLMSAPGAVAAVHLGWRSVKAQLLARVVETFTGLGQGVEDIHMALGPALSQPHFEVEDHFIGAFGVADEARFFASSANPGKVMMDLGGIIRAQAVALGIKPAHIHALSLCTYAGTDMFYSYRQDTQNGRASVGRQVSLIRKS